MLLEPIRMAARVIRTRKLRSLLTILSITVGAYQIVAFISMAASAERTLGKGLEELGGARLIDVAPKTPERAEKQLASYSDGLTVRDRDLLFSAVPFVVARSMFAVMDHGQLLTSDSGFTGDTDLLAGDASVLGLYQMHIARGRGFTERENRSHAPVCVVGHKTAQKLWHGDAIGHWLTVDGFHCRVIGQLANEDRVGINFGFDWLDLVVTPLASLADADGSVMARAELLFKTDDTRHNELVKRLINHFLVERHHGVDDFQLIDFRDLMKKFDQTFNVMKAVVACLATIALLVGGAGVMNIMLVSVSERVGEIGIRKALGASPRDIAAQFILEAMMLAGAGGLLGTLQGVLVALATVPLIQRTIPSWVGVVSIPAAVGAIGTALTLGLVFGYLPARAAARLPAVEAIRQCG
jgi:putative ABC transport system permease protein